MPFIDLNNNAASAASGSTNNGSQSVIINDDQESIPTPSVSNLDMDKLAAEGALPVLPPSFSVDGNAEAAPEVNTLDLTSNTLSLGNQVRQIQGAGFDELANDQELVSESDQSISDSLTNTVTEVTDPIMDVSFANDQPTAASLDQAPFAEQVVDLTEQSMGNVSAIDLTDSVSTALVQNEVVDQIEPVKSEQDDDINGLLNTLQAEKPNLADYKPTNQTDSVGIQASASEVSASEPPAAQTNVAETPQIIETSADDSGLKLGIENVSSDSLLASDQPQVAEAQALPPETASIEATQPAVLQTPAKVEPPVEAGQLVEATLPVEQPATETIQSQTEAVAESFTEPIPVQAAEPVVPVATTYTEATAIAPVTIPEQTATTQAVAAQENLQSRMYSLNEMLAEAVNMGASDLHLTAGYRAMARLDGKLTQIKSQILQHEDILTMLSETVAGHSHVDLQHDLDIDISYQIDNPLARFRVNIFYQQGTIGAVFRVIPEHIRTVEELKLPPVVKEFTALPQGLVLVTGPTGSGKTTTLAALVNQINTTEPKHIITIEDPIEYVYPKGVGLVDQRAVYIDTPDWHTALRAVLRQDPNVVLIGEMRDTETMEAALTIAETGHLVFSTLHTNSASQTIDRIIDAFPEEKQGQVRTQLASVLTAVISQRLLPVTGGGRRVATEIMIVTPAIKNAIREQKVYQIDNIIQTSAELGMHTLEKSLVNLVREGVISPEVAQAQANRPDDVMTYLSKN